MAKLRQVIPKAVRDSVLKEFNHRCAVCGADGPQFHHIDENPANNDPLNIIPLCPNCHLVDQHNASNAIPKPQLRFFRKHKHRLVLKPRFNSLLRRMAFLEAVPESADTGVLEKQSAEFIALVASLSMGTFYANEIKKLIKPPRYARFGILGDPAYEARIEAQLRSDAKEYRQQLRTAAPAVEDLVVELLDHQNWE